MKDLLSEKHEKVLEGLFDEENLKIKQMLKALGAEQEKHHTSYKGGFPFYTIVPTPKNSNYYKPTFASEKKQRRTELRQYYYATYSDGEQKYDIFNKLSDAVRLYSRDIMGHTLVHIKDENGTVLWASEGGYHPDQPMSERAIESVNAASVDKFIKDYWKYFQSYIRDSKTEKVGSDAGVTFSFEDGVITLKDAKGLPRKLFRLTVEEVTLVKHQFNKDFVCETCNRHMGEIPEPTGLCTPE